MRFSLNLKNHEPRELWFYKPQQRSSIKNNKTFRKLGKALIWGPIQIILTHILAKNLFLKKLVPFVFSIYSPLTSSRLLEKVNEWSVKNMMNIQMWGKTNRNWFWSHPSQNVASIKYVLNEGVRRSSQKCIAIVSVTSLYFFKWISYIQTNGNKITITRCLRYSRVTCL